jgi:tetratricopeptide (TPR) repeat protein
VAHAQAIDHDSDRREIRDAVRRGDRRRLLELAEQEPARALPPKTVELLAFTLERYVRAPDRAVALLGQARELRPGDFWINHALAHALTQLKPPRHAEALRYYHSAQALRPQSPAVHYNLGNTFRRLGDLSRAARAYREAIRLKGDFVQAHNNLGITLLEAGEVDEAQRVLREALRIRPNHAPAHNNLGRVLEVGKRLDEAQACYEAALRLRPEDALARSNLGNVFAAKGQADKALAAYQKAIQLNPEFVEPRIHLGNFLVRTGRSRDALASFREALRIDPNSALAHYGTGLALTKLGRLDDASAALREAIARMPRPYAGFLEALGYAYQQKGEYDRAVATYRDALRLAPRNSTTHYNLGNAYSAQGLVDEAINAYRESLSLNPKHAEAHFNLGHNLTRKAQFADALQAYRRGQGLGSRERNYPSAQWIRDCERLLELERRLPHVLRGEAPSPSPSELFGLGTLCAYQRRFAASARFYREAIAADPKLVSALKGNRHLAACSAAAVGCGQGEDGKELEEAQRAPWRKQALEWLRADLNEFTSLVRSGDANQRRTVRNRLLRWQVNPTLAGVREPEQVRKLPAGEQEAFRRLWFTVAWTVHEIDRLTAAEAAERPEPK